MERLRAGFVFLLVLALIVGGAACGSEDDEETVLGLVNQYLAALDARDWQTIYELRRPDSMGSSYEEAEPEIVELFNDMMRNSCGAPESSPGPAIGGTDIDVLVMDDQAVASWKITCDGQRVNVTVAQRLTKIDGRWYLEG